jgi:zinc transport system substrate-binding protein
MKLLVVILLSAGMLFSVPFHIVTSFYPLQIMTLNLAKDVPNVIVENLAPPQTGCLHDFSLTPKQLRSLSKASVLIVNGQGMESFLDKVISQFPNLPVITATEGISVLRSEGRPNAHLWLSVPLAGRIIYRLASQLSILDPSHGQAYQQNASRYDSELSALDQWMKKELSPYRGLNILTFHDAMPYFATEYGFNVVGVIEREPGSEPNAREIVALRKQIADKRVRAVFAEPQYPDKMAALIVRGSTARLAKLDPIVTGPVRCSAYLDIMKQNVLTLKEALKP